MKTTLGKRIWSAILALVMVASLLSVPVMAEGTEDITDGIVESNVVDVSAEGGDDLGGVEATPAEAPTPEEEPTPEATDAPAEESGNTDGAAAAASVSLTLRLPEGLSADGMDVVTRTVNADGAIDPIVISSEDEGAFSAALAEAINKNSSISENSLHITYNANDDTLTLSGTPSASVELDMEEILIAAMEESGAYDAELTPDEHYHSVCGEAYYCNTHKDAHEWHEWNGTSEISYTDNFEHLYLTQSVTRSETLTVESGKTLYLCLNGNTITGPSGKDVITVATGGTLIITDCQTSVGSITHAENATGRGIANYGTLTLWNGSITGNTNSGDKGAGVYNSGTFTMSGTAKITNCTAAVDEEYNGGEGGGVYNNLSSTFTMNGGTISGCTAESGGGVYNMNKFTMEGGEITGCIAAYNGGGVYNTDEFTMEGGEITGCIAAYSGGGVYNADEFTMKDGKITGCTTRSSGGGVCSYGTFNMNGGSIAKNSAAGGYSCHGGGVFNAGTFAMSGGSITENTATSATATDNGKGGGVFNNGTFKVSGTPNISGNVKGGTITNGELSGGTANNVFVLTISYSLSGQDTQTTNYPITVESDKPLTSAAEVYITGSEGQQVVTGTDKTTGFFCDAEGYVLASNGSNGLKIVEAQTHCVCGSTTCTSTDNGHSGKITWTAWTSATSLPDEAGNYYLTQDVELDATWQCGYNVNLCLNGQTITGASGQDVITVASDASLTITDCGTTGEITHNSDVNGRGIYNNGTLILWNGSITGNTASGNGAGVYNNGTFTMSGGSITNNNYTDGGWPGGGVYNTYNCTFNMTGGSITGNKGHTGGGVENAHGATFNMSGGSITGNSIGMSWGGGGVWNSGTLNISGKVEITGNTTSANATENVYLYNYGIVKVNGELDSTTRVGITGSLNQTAVEGSVDTTVFTSDSTDHELVADGSNLKWVAVHKHCVCGKTDCSGDGHDTSTTWTAWTSATSLPDEAGNYYLTQDVELDATWQCGYNVNLCLNGQTITGASGADVIYLNEGKTLDITDCTTDSTKVGKITHAEGATGRGIYNRGTLNFWNGCVTGNRLTGDSDKGAGVCNTMGGNPIFNMYGGSITGNYCKNYGGGVFNDKTWNMSGGEISGNSVVAFGGGVNNKGTFNMTGGSITGNSVTGSAPAYGGGGVYNDSGTFKVSGNVTISGNKKESADNNVQGTVTAIGNMGSDAKVGITGGEVKGSTDTTVFTSDNADLELVPVSGGLKLAAFHKHCVCGANTSCGDDHNTDTKWTGIASLSEITEDGKYYLTQDVELTGAWIVNADIKLCLNGHSITQKTSGQDVIQVSNSGSLTITDCTTGSTKVGKITGGSRGICNSGKLTLWNGSITGNKNSGVDGGGGGVCNTSFGTFTMHGGSITANVATAGSSGKNAGGGVWNAGTFTMNNGSITGNSAMQGGGVFNIKIEDTDAAAFTMNGGSIANNHASYAGGGVANAGTFDMTGGEITGNTDTNVVGGVLNMGTFKMSGGSITENMSQGKGDNGALPSGGGVVNMGTLNMSGAPVVKDNKTNCTEDDDGALTGGTVCNVYVYYDSTKKTNYPITLTGGLETGASIGVTGNLNQTVVTGTTSATGFKCDNTDYELVESDDSGLKLVAKSVTISGVELLNETGGEKMTNNTKVYDGKAVAYTAGSATDVDGVGLTYTWQKATTTNGTTTYADLTAAPSDAGNYRLHVEAKKNNVTHGSADYYFTISKATPAADDCTVTMSGWTYGGTASTPVTTSQYNGNTATVVYTDVSGAVVEQPTNAGTYTATATFPANDNYNAGTATTTFTISPKELTVDVTAANKTYDGDTTATVTATLNTSGVVSGDKVELNTSGVSATFENANADTGKAVKLTGEYTLGGTGKGNYTLKQPTGIKANISQRELTITGATVASKTYDGKTDATITAVTFGNMVTGETLTLGEDYTVSNAAYDHPNADGTDKATKVTFTVTLADTDNAKNYKLKTAEGTQSATIGKADHQSYTVEDTGKRGSQNSYEIAESWIVDGGSVSVTSVSDGSSILGNRPSCNGRVLNYELTQGATETQNATVTLMVTSDNYNAYTITVTIKVAAKTEVTITVTPADEYVYNGSAQAPTTISVSDGKVPLAALETKYVGTGTTSYDSATAPTNAGSYTMTVRVADSNLEYYGSTTCDFEIKPKTLTATITATNKIYDGNATATVTPTLDGVVESDSGKVTATVTSATFASKNVGTGKEVTASIRLTGDAAGNYSVNATAKTTASITPKTLTVKDLAVASKTYDGTNTATISGTPALVGVAENDTVTLAAGTPTFSSVNVGEDIAISFTNFSISGDDADNYELTQPTGIKANINAYNATKNTEYSVNSNNWINTDFVVTPTSGWKISYTNTADGNWVDELKVSEQNYNGTLEFYLRNDTSGIISEKITETYRIDKTVPTITGAENGKTYCAAVTLTITDANLDRVTLNGETVELTADGKLTLDPTAQPAPVALNTLALDGATDGEQTVVATDAAGNSTTITLTVNDGHTWGEWTSNGDNTHNRACQFDAAHTETEDCHGGKATCKDKAECEVCGEKYGEPDPHNHADLEHVEAKDATTSAEGNIEYWHCEDCGKYFKDADATEEITKTDTVTAKRKDSAARTGDESNAALWLLLLVGSGAGMATLGKKKRYSK